MNIAVGASTHTKRQAIRLSWKVGAKWIRKVERKLHRGGRRGKDVAAAVI